MPTTYDVRVWKTERYQGAKVTSYRVRWKVGARSWKEVFRTSAQAASFRAELLAAARKGEAFDVETGRPVSHGRARSEMSWYEFACRYVDAKWPAAAGKYRKSIAEALVTVTAGLFAPGRGRPDEAVLRLALRNYAFNTAHRGDPDKPAEQAAALRWAERHTLPVATLADPSAVRAVLDGLAQRLDGGRAAPNTVNRKRAVFANALGYATELGLLPGNPLAGVRWSAPKAPVAVDRRCVVNPVQARTLLIYVAEQQRSGPRLVAFFACIYYAGLRPEEVANLRKHNLSLPATGWGEVHVEGATPDTGRAWTDTGRQRDERQLKHRAEGEVRTVPCPPELTALLHSHLARHGTDPDGRLFWADRGSELRTNTYARVWARARAAAFTPEVARSPLAGRPYDLRHAAVSTWLAAGVPPTQVAEWAGHSVAVLLRVYAKCLDGQQHAARQRVEAALRG